MLVLTRWVLAHRRLVALLWVAAALTALPLLPKATAALSQVIEVPGREGYETNAAILAEYGTGGVAAPTPVVAVVELPEGRPLDSAEVQADLTGVFARVQAALPGTRTASYASTGDRDFVSADGRTTFGLVWLPAAAAEQAGEQLAEALAGAQVAGAPVQLTGVALLAGEQGHETGPGVLLEVLLGGLGALVVLVFVFRSVLALVPLAMAAVAIPVTFLLVWGLTSVTEVSFLVQFLIALIGLGIAIDYALLIVVRWREERASGWDAHAAVERAMVTAGEAVVFSGTTVAVGLLALVALPVPFLRSLGYGGLLIALVSVAVAVTLLPVVLATVGPRLDRLGLPAARHPERGWQRWGQLVVRRRWTAAAAGLTVLAALAAPALALNPGDPAVTALASGGPARDALGVLERSGIGVGPLTPYEVLVRSADPADAAARVADAAVDVPGIAGAVAPSDAQWQRAGSALLDVLPTSDGTSQDTVQQLRAAVGEQGRVGGAFAQDADFVDAVYGRFPLMLALLTAITLLLLTRVFRSVVLPIKAVLLNALSVAAVWGFLVLFWQQGHGSDELFGITATGSISAFAPLIVFAFLFGLSMDYEVFILARVREEYDRTGSTDTATVLGIAKTGRLVTSAGLILFLAFTALAANPETEVKILATGLAVGILLDATVVRALLLPAVLSLLGDSNWWLPRPLARLLRLPHPTATAQPPRQPSRPTAALR